MRVRLYKGEVVVDPSSRPRYSRGAIGRRRLGKDFALTPTLLSQTEVGVAPANDSLELTFWSIVPSMPRSEAAVIRHFQERMPYGLFVPEVDMGK